LADRVLMKIFYLLLRWLFSLAVLAFRGDQAKDAELVVLRRENAVLRRHGGRVRYEPADRARFAALARFIPRKRWAEVFPVTPVTLLAWHRKLTARKYGTSRRRQPVRPPTVRGIAGLTVGLAKENPLRGYRRIHGELTKLGVTITPSTVWEILRAAGIGPAPHPGMPDVAAVPARSGRRDHRRRLPARRHRAAEEARRMRTSFVTAQETGTTILRTAVQAPRMNAICERLIGTWAGSSWTGSSS
jgi:hypothetical protein